MFESLSADIKARAELAKDFEIVKRGCPAYGEEVIEVILWWLAPYFEAFIADAQQSLRSPKIELLRPTKIKTIKYEWFLHPEINAIVFYLYHDFNGNKTGVGIRRKKT